MRKLRLAIRLILSVAIIQITTFGTLAWNNTRLNSINSNELLHRVAHTNSALLAEALAPKLAASNRPALLHTLELLKDFTTLRYAAVFNTQRQLLASLGEPPPLSQHSVDGFHFLFEETADSFNVEQPISITGGTLGLLQVGFTNLEARSPITEPGFQNTAIILTGLFLSVIAIVVISVPVSQDLDRIQAAVQVLKKGEWEHRIVGNKWNVTIEAVQAINALATQQEAKWDEMRHQYEYLCQESRRFNTLLHGIRAVVWNLDPREGRFLYVSNEAERLLDYPIAEWLEADFCDLHIHPSDLEWVKGFLTQPDTTSGNFTLDFRIFNSANECLWLRMISSVEFREKGPLLTGLLLDVTEEKRNEQRIAYLADHDPLTGLINRRCFQERLKEQINYNERYHASAALLFIDLDQFKYINDTHGHHTGDEYLRQVAHHLRRSLRKSDIIGRLGGDEFGIILPNADIEQGINVSEHVLKYLNSQEFIHDDRRTPFSASIGIAVFPEHGNKASDLLAKADSAMYTAKDQGRNTYRTFEESIDAARMQEKIKWEARIRHALKNDLFQLYFQPIVDIHSGQISHYESLLRMLGDNGEIIAPGAFIGVAERFGMIREIDKWVVTNAIRAQGASVKLGKPISLTVNLSGRHFGNPEILEVIQEAAQRYNAVPNSIVFEVTETAAVENFTEACNFIRSLRNMGFRFALDDFGAGFSSFDYLKNIPVDFIKIDGSFVRNLPNDRVDQIFVSAIAEMARGLGVQAIAEFVENQEIVDMLKQLGVSLGQGFFFAKPQPRFHTHERIIISSGVGQHPLVE